jgi:hypothetical protein
MTHPARGVCRGRKPGDPLLSDDRRQAKAARQERAIAALAPPPPWVDAYTLAQWHFALVREGRLAEARTILDRLEYLARRPPVWRDGEEPMTGK